MENNTNETCSSNNKSCYSSVCELMHIGMNRHHSYILKRFFYLALLIAVFCFGFQLGELKTLSRSMHKMHAGSMMKWDKNVSYDMGQGMMKVEVTNPAPEKAPEVKK